MPIFALTGNLGSGKTTIINLLKKEGVIVFDTDKKIHKYYNNRKNKIYKKIVHLFPEVVENGKILRKKLASIVFCDKKKLEKLENIVHPQIIRDLKKWINKNKDKKRICVAEVPLLFEKKLESYFEGIILVYAKKEILIKRIRKKFGISRKEAIRRLSLQIPFREKEKKADFLISNNYSLLELRKKIKELIEKLKKFN
ncbi:MAG: dephospho-CoA kinase [Candidatus Aenigmatarchaeota archaeon]